MEEDTYVYVSVKLYLSPGQTLGSIQEVLQDCDYSFTHDDIIEHEIVDILDVQIPEEDTGFRRNGFGPEDFSGFPEMIDPFSLPD